MFREEILFANIRLGFSAIKNIYNGRNHDYPKTIPERHCWKQHYILGTIVKITNWYGWRPLFQCLYRWKWIRLQEIYGSTDIFTSIRKWAISDLFTEINTKWNIRQFAAVIHPATLTGNCIPKVNIFIPLCISGCISLHSSLVLER